MAPLLIYTKFLHELQRTQSWYSIYEYCHLWMDTTDVVSSNLDKGKVHSIMW